MIQVEGTHSLDIILKLLFRNQILIRCGPARHSLQLAKKGHKVFALDTHPGLLSYAKGKANEEGVDINFLNEDMQEFELKVGCLKQG